MTNEHNREMASRAVQLALDSSEEFEAAYWELPREWRVRVDRCLSAQSGLQTLGGSW